MRRRRLKKLIRRLRELQRQDLTRDELKLGAAKKEAGKAYALLVIHTPTKDQPVTFSATVFAYQVTAGASYPVTDHVSLTGSYRYLGTSEGTFNTTLYNGLTSLGTAPAKVAFSDNVIRFGVRYTFN